MIKEMQSEHQFYYQTDAPVTARMLADSLLGLEGVVEKSGHILRRLIPDVGRLDAEVLIQSIELGSIDEKFLVRLIFGKGKAGEKKIEALRKTLGLKNMDSKKIIGFAIALAIAYAAYLYLQKKPDPALNVHIENSFNTIGAEMNMSRDEALALVESAITNKEELKKHVVKLIHPSSDEKSGHISLDNNPALSISHEVIKAVPLKYDQTDAEEPIQDFQNIQIVVRAADLDKVTQGWAAIIPEISDSRLPVHVMAEIDVNKVPIGKYFRGNITVVYKVDKNGNKTPKRYLLSAIIEEKH